MPLATWVRARTWRLVPVFLSIALLVAHAPLFLNDGVFMDDWLVLKLNPGYAVDLSFLVNGAGHPIFFIYYSIANATGAPVAVMAAMTIFAVLVGAICLALAATRSGLLSRCEAIGVTLLVWTYPGYQMWAGKGNAVYVFSFGLFFLASWLLTRAFDSRGLDRFFFRVASASIFFLSFALNSLMMLYLFVILGLFVAVCGANRRGRTATLSLVLSAWRCAAGYPEFLVLPLLYWAALNIWFKRVGAYADYYGIHLPMLTELRSGWNAFFQIGCMNVLARAGQMLSIHWMVSTLMVGLIVLAAWVLRAREVPPRVSASEVMLPLLLSVAMFFALSMPYLIVGIRPNLAFYETRHLLLFGLPAALLALAVKRLLQGAVGDRAALIGVFGLASIVSLAALWNSYIFTQARTLRQEALYSHLREIPMPAATVFDLVDGFRNYSPRFAPFGLAEVSGMLRLAWGDHPFFGFSLPGERPTILREMESAWNTEGSPFHSMDPSGPQATISLKPGPAAAPDAVLVQRYYACRLLARCDVTNLLTQLAVVTIDIGPIAGVLPLVRSR